MTQELRIPPEERERLLAKYSSDVIAVLEPGGVVLYVSPACRTLFGYEPEELVGRSSYDFVDPDDASVAERTHALALDGAELVTTPPFRVRRKDGTLIWVETTVRPVRDAESGRIQELHSTTRDVSERMQAEEELRESEARYRLLAVNSTDVIAVSDRDGVLRYVSPACRTVTGYEPEELVGRSGYEFVHPDDRTQIVEALADLPQGPITPDPYRIRRKDGSYLWVESTVKAIRDRGTGDAVEVHTSTRDATRRKEVEQALQLANAELERSNRALEQFAYDVSHDLGEPIRVMTQVFQRLTRDHGDQLGPQSRRLIVAITDGLERMRMLISDLLEFSKVSRDPPRRDSVNCAALLCETLKVLEEAIREKQATVTCDSLPTVKAHPTQLRQVFQNLLSNALKFAGETPLTVHVSAERIEPAAWRFSVGDNGIGIDPKDARGVFEMFRRLNTKDACVGTGMGLSICKRIVEHHGGQIWVETNHPRGSVFKFTIPDE
jgi:PAS domain S-box-containing protein